MHSRGGVQLSPLGFAACQSKNCTNQAIGNLHWLVHFLLDWYTFGLVGALETSAPPESYTNKQSTLKGVQLSPLGFAACQSKNCTNKAICELLLGWCTFCLIGALETSAPPKSCTTIQKYKTKGYGMRHSLLSYT